MPPKSPFPRTPPPAPSGGKSADSMIVDIIVAVVVFLLIAGFLRSFFTSAMGNYVNVITRFYDINWKLWYIIAAILAGIFDIALLFLAFSIIKRFNKLRAEAPPEEIVSRMISPEQEFGQNWQEIKELIGSESASDWNMAILRADAKLDELLNNLGYEGDTIAERLKIVDPTKLKSMDRIWSAHRLRNTIAHDPLQQYTREMVTHALDSYQLAFQELGFLQSADTLPATLPEKGRSEEFPETSGDIPFQ